MILCFLVARRFPAYPAAIGAAALYLGAWLAGYYVTDARLMGVPVGAMSSVAHPWLLLYVPASVGIGVLARRSARVGVLGDLSLSLPLLLALPEATFMWRGGWAVGLVAGAAPMLIATLAVWREWRRRPVSLRMVALGVACGAAGIFAILHWAMRYPV